MTIPASTMTTPTNATDVPAVAQVGPETGDQLDIRKVISGSTADVPISELSRKGFKQVKVLNQAMITKLIAEAVDRVMASRAKKISREEREKVINESTSQFETLAKERLQRERDRIGELERANQSLLAETESLRNHLAAREEEIAALRTSKEETVGTDRFVEALLRRLPGLGSAPEGEVSQLQQSLREISNKLERIQLKSAAGDQAPIDKEAVIDALFRLDAGEAPDSNIGKVKIKETKAGGVKDTLAKLKAMQKGGKDGD